MRRLSTLLSGRAKLLLSPNSSADHGSAGASPYRQRRAFALADLLVVIAVIAVLAAIGVPAIQRARAKSRLAQCLANLQQVNRATLLYAEDHARRIPYTNAPAPGGWWFYKELVKGYIGLSGPSSPADKVFACPSDRGYGERGDVIVPFAQSKKHDFTSYNLNSIDLPGIPQVGGRELGSIREPDKTLLTMEWVAHAPLSWHRSRTGRANTPFYNDAESVVGFVDGHIAFIPIYYDGLNAAYTRDPIPGYLYKYSGD